jgi:hypothetical protein
LSKKAKHTILFFIFLLLSGACFSQKDSTLKPIPADSMIKKATMISDRAKADSVRRAFSPKKATIRSALIPGWGQVYNKKYWKVPIVYGALGVAGGIFLYNLKNYREIRFAYAAKYKASIGTTHADSADYFNIKPYLLPFNLNSLRSFRDEFRSNIDYSVLAFLLLWGLNVVDATVDAHLKLFDVSPDLSLRLKFGPSQMAGTTGFSLVLGFKPPKKTSRWQ